jgi:hypothetical protein
MSKVYKNLRVENGNISAETCRVTLTHTVVSALAAEGEITNEEYLELLGSTENAVLDMGDTFNIIRNTEESDMSTKVAHAMTGDYQAVRAGRGYRLGVDAESERHGVDVGDALAQDEKHRGRSPPCRRSPDSPTGTGCT